MPDAVETDHAMSAQAIQRTASGLTTDVVFSNSGVFSPRLVYGTAWKADRTANLVYKALKAGFRGIDTAAQPRHYNESQVGEGIRRAIRDGIVRRHQLFVQTKFTLPAGQDPDNMPYPMEASLTDQVHASISSSLRHLACPADNAHPESQHTPIIDSLVLHSPARTLDDTLTIWSTLSTYVPHTIRQLGISNLHPDSFGSSSSLGLGKSARSPPPSHLLSYLLTSPEIQVRPAVLQNRFHAATNWDVDLRAAYCAENSPYLDADGKEPLGYQSFWTLTANTSSTMALPVDFLADAGPARTLAHAAGVSPEAALYSLVLGLAPTMTVLIGTTSESHMHEDLEGFGRVGAYINEGAEAGRVWEECLGRFAGLIGDKGFRSL